MIGSLTVLYDADCPACVRLQGWLAGQVQLVPLIFVPAGSAEARRRFPTLDHQRTLTDITVIADDGALYRKDRAMVMCLWALARWRDVALHAAVPYRRPFVVLAARGVDRWRRRVNSRARPTSPTGGAYRAGHGYPAPITECRRCAR